ncbi:MAG: hypothetical protein H0U27_04825 [Nitrosopumilus sp.]|nr:hypothetical protein [Nitrosopumilus sp.]
MRKTKTQPGEVANIDSTKNITGSSENKQLFLRDIEAVFTTNVTNQQGQQPNLPRNDTRNNAPPQQGLQNQQFNPNNSLNQQSQQSSSQNNSATTSTQSSPSTGQPQSLINSNTNLLTNDQANDFMDYKEELVVAYALSQEAINNSTLDSTTLNKIKSFNPHQENAFKLSSLIVDSKKKISFINQIKSSDTKKKYDAQDFIRRNKNEINQFIKNHGVAEGKPGIIKDGSYIIDDPINFVKYFVQEQK